LSHTTYTARNINTALGRDYATQYEQSPAPFFLLWDMSTKQSPEYPVLMCCCHSGKLYVVSVSDDSMGKIMADRHQLHVIEILGDEVC
jgi:hypothetical protein